MKPASSDVVATPPPVLPTARTIEAPPEIHAPGRSFGRAVALRHRRLAGLAVRRAGHAPLHAGGAAVRGPAAGDRAPRIQQVGTYGSIIQASFLVGWALGGGFFGRIGDRMGRSRALMLTILTYALFTGLSFFAQTVVAPADLSIPGGAGHRRRVGRRRGAACRKPGREHWRPWMAAVLQTAVNVGIMLASLAAYFMAGLPNTATCSWSASCRRWSRLWIRRAVPETEEWHAARRSNARQRAERVGICFAATCAGSRC